MKSKNFRISGIVSEYEPKLLKTDFSVYYGDVHDGVIEIVPITQEGALLEAGAYFGDVKDRNIVSISTQIGCPSTCSFCEIGPENFKRNLSVDELYEQVILALKLQQKAGIDIEEKKIKVSTGKMGETLFNNDFVGGLEKIAQLGASYKPATIFPDSKRCYENFERIARFAASYSEPLHIQVSLVSTSEKYRQGVTKLKLAGFKKIREMGERWKELNPNGRDINLSLILSSEVPADPDDVCGILTPDIFRFRFRNYVPTDNGRENYLAKIELEKMRELKKRFADKGYKVSDWATPTPTEQRFGLAASVTRRRYKQTIAGLI